MWQLALLGSAACLGAFGKCLGLIAGLSFPCLTARPPLLIFSFARSLVPFACLFWKRLPRGLRSVVLFIPFQQVMAFSWREWFVKTCDQGSCFSQMIAQKFTSMAYHRLGFWVLMTPRAMLAGVLLSWSGINHAKLGWQTNVVKDWKCWKSNSAQYPIKNRLFGIHICNLDSKFSLVIVFFFSYSP